MGTRRYCSEAYRQRRYYSEAEGKSGGCAWELMYETRRICDGKGEGGETRLDGDGTEEQCKGLAVETQRHRLAVACSARSIRRLS